MNNQLTDFQDDDLSDDILDRIAQSRVEREEEYFFDNDEEQLFFRTFEVLTEPYELG